MLKRNLVYLIGSLQDFIGNTAIFVYEQPLLESNLFNEYSDCVTYFPVVSDNIALEFIDSEVKLSLSSKEELAANCQNNYNNILLETDKIRQYALGKHISEQSAYDELNMSGQLLYAPEKYKSNEFMNDVLRGNYNTMGYWFKLINTYYKDEFWMSLGFIFNDYLIAYLIVKYGRYNGSNKAYDFGLPWNRTKEIRELIIPYEPEYLLQSAYKVSKLDSDIKKGNIAIEDLFDHFMCTIM